MVKTRLDEILKEYSGLQANLSLEIRRLSQILCVEEMIFEMNKKQKVVLCRLWLEQQIEKGEVCVKCGSKDNLTLDHIVPVSIFNTFGKDEDRLYMPENYQVMCKRCNTFKSSKLDPVNPITKKILIDLVNTL